MKFEIFNNTKKRIFNTTDFSCIPNKRELISMSDVGYRFKLDGKDISKKKIIEFIIQEKGNIK